MDHHITTFNASEPQQYTSTRERTRLHSDGPAAELYSQSKLGLSGSCLFVRGQKHLQDQNLTEAINVWSASLEASGSESVKVDSNYWIGYLNNTIGEYGKSSKYFEAAADIADDKRKPELVRLVLETQLFSLELGQVPDKLVNDAEKSFRSFVWREIPARRAALFALLIGNILLVKNLRHAIKSESGVIELVDSNKWFDIAIEF